MRFLRKRRYIEKRIFNAPTIAIVADAAMGTRDVGDGRLIPLIILDTQTRRDVAEFIRIHEHFPPGDVISQWAELLDGTERILLVLKFKKLMDIEALIEFRPARHHGLIDQIIHTNAVYIQAGKPGDRFADKIEEPKVLVEIPETGFGKVWDEMFFDIVVKQIRESGFKKKNAKEAAREYITQWRQFGSVRIGSKWNPKADKESQTLD